MGVELNQKGGMGEKTHFSDDVISNGPGLPKSRVRREIIIQKKFYINGRSPHPLVDIRLWKLINRGEFVNKSLFYQLYQFSLSTPLIMSMTFRSTCTHILCRAY